MASWLINLPWINDPTYDFLEYYSGAARVSRLAQAFGYVARAFDVAYDSPPEGKSQHSGRNRRSAFDINGEGGFVFLSKLMVISRYGVHFSFRAPPLQNCENSLWNLVTLHAHQHHQNDVGSGCRS